MTPRLAQHSRRPPEPTKSESLSHGRPHAAFILIAATVVAFIGGEFAVQVAALPTIPVRSVVIALGAVAGTALCLLAMEVRLGRRLDRLQAQEADVLHEALRPLAGELGHLRQRTRDADDVWVTLLATNRSVSALRDEVREAVKDARWQGYAAGIADTVQTQSKVVQFPRQN